MTPKYATPGRAAAVRQAAAIRIGDVVGIYCEELSKYGPTRRTDTYLGKVVGHDILGGGTIPTGRLKVETSTICHYQKTATRGGQRMYQYAKGQSRVLLLWPWDVVPTDSGST